MDNENRETLLQIAGTLQKMLLGKPCEPIPDPESCDAEVREVAELTNILAKNIQELNSFAIELSKGNLDGPLPARRNYLAGTLKELHAQLLSFVWSVGQLERGSVVERLDYRGELSDALNSLIAKMSELSTRNLNLNESQDANVNSWQYHQVSLAINHLQMMVLQVEADGKVLFLNKQAKGLLGNLTDLRTDQVPEAVSAIVDCLWDNCVPDANFPLLQEICNEKTGRWYTISTDQITFPDGRLVYLHVLEDISEWKNSEEQLHKSATVDQLTGVYNRAYGISALEAMISEEPGAHFHCVAFIDIDNLKGINDTHGHHEGDYAISTIAGVLASAVRTSDVISRLGGDEFLIVFYNCRVPEAEQIIARMLARLEAINSEQTKPYRLEFSHGLVQISAESGISAEEIVMLADKKMYERKTNKKRQERVAVLDKPHMK